MKIDHRDSLLNKQQHLLELKTYEHNKPANHLYGCRVLHLKQANKHDQQHHQKMIKSHESKVQQEEK